MRHHGELFFCAPRVSWSGAKQKRATTFRAVSFFMNRRRVLQTAFIAGCGIPFLPSTAQAGEAAVYTGIVDGVGAGGYDLVAYHRENAPRRGDADIAADHKGVAYRFASTENREAFVAAPQKYLPQFGGYCAWAVANGYTAKGDPEAWSLVGGKLYMNYSHAVRSKWQEDAEANISAANANWPKVLE